MSEVIHGTAARRAEFWALVEEKLGRGVAASVRRDYEADNPEDMDTFLTGWRWDKVADAVGTLLDARDIQRRRARQRQRSPLDLATDELEPRALALEQWMVRLAHPIAERCRSRFGCPLLDEAEVGAWIRERLPAPEALGDGPSRVLWWCDPPRTKRLPWQQECEEIGDQLEGLRETSEHLAATFRWQRAEATMFILSAWVPAVAPVTVNYEWRGSLPTFHTDVTTRVHLEVDPSVTPSQLAAIWAAQRDGIFHQGRHRAMSAKHLKLAEFMATRPSDLPTEDDRRAWNAVVNDAKGELRTEWAYGYEDRRNFHRDAKAAVDRLLNVGYTTML
jgi:hypothetical protein